MALTNSYLVTTKNLEAFFNALTTAQAPERFTQKFLENLEFKSSNDRLYIGLLKSLGFTDENGIPLDRYYSFLDQTQSRKVLATAIREAYGDLFAVNVKAQEMGVQEVKNKLRTLTQGKKSDNVLQFMANTFHALCSYAEWDGTTVGIDEDKTKEEKVKMPDEALAMNRKKTFPSDLHYNIQIHLPETRDQNVYDAIFRSLQDHLF